MGDTIREYDSNGNLIHYKNSHGYEQWWEYDNNGNRIHAKDSHGYETWWEYDNNRNRIHSKDSDGYGQWWEYDNNGNLNGEVCSVCDNEWETYLDENQMLSCVHCGTTVE